MSNWLMDKIETSTFDESVDVTVRFDGLFNLWRKRVEFSKRDGFTSYWEVVNVFKSKAEGLAAKEKLRPRSA